MDQPALSKEELIAHVGALNAEIAALNQRMDEMRWVEGSLKQRTRVLNERIKELECTHDALRLVRRPGLSVEAKVQAVVNLLPKAWQHSGSACARATLGRRTFVTAGFAESDWVQSETVTARGRALGTVEVRYRLRHAAQDEGPFLREERVLLSVIAECLGLILEDPSFDAWKESE